MKDNEYPILFQSHCIKILKAHLSASDISDAKRLYCTWNSILINAIRINFIYHRIYSLHLEVYLLQDSY